MKEQEIDVRGLSCPQPVVEVRKKIMEMESGKIKVLADSGTAVDNITRLANSNGWEVQVEEEKDDYILLLTKG